MKGRNSDLLFIKLLILCFSVASGFLRIISDNSLLEFEVGRNNVLIYGYFFLPLACILPIYYTVFRLPSLDIAAKAPFFFLALIHLMFIGYLSFWILFSLARNGLGISLDMLANAMDSAIILLLIGNFVLDRESRQLHR